MSNYNRFLESFSETLDSISSLPSFFDQNQLTKSDGDIRTQKTEQQSPNSQNEILLIKIWQEVFETEQIDCNDNFFALGGHSLLAVKMIQQIQKQLNVK